jgi:hypothetical protein
LVGAAAAVYEGRSIAATGDAPPKPAEQPWTTRRRGSNAPLEDSISNRAVGVVQVDVGENHQIRHDDPHA